MKPSTVNYQLNIDMAGITNKSTLEILLVHAIRLCADMMISYQGIIVDSKSGVISKTVKNGKVKNEVTYKYNYRVN